MTERHLKNSKVGLVSCISNSLKIRTRYSLAQKSTSFWNFSSALRCLIWGTTGYSFIPLFHAHMRLVGELLRKQIAFNMLMTFGITSSFCLAWRIWFSVFPHFLCKTGACMGMSWLRLYPNKRVVIMLDWGATTGYDWNYIGTPDWGSTSVIYY